jgi:hypothetical protein
MTHVKGMLDQTLEDDLAIEERALALQGAKRDATWVRHTEERIASIKRAIEDRDD